MSYYRLYFRNRKGGFLRVEELYAASDDQALGQAQSLAKGHDFEIWQQRRRVGVVSAAA
ncbi:hypothetical protein [Sphingomonas sp.]|uniref:hypothetical protein n=1 Tax=Sphingomonas sp. TaxID=28214 RepID=UPI002ED97A02